MVAATAARMRSLLFAALVGLVLVFPASGSEPIKIVATTNVYGDIAQQIGGEHVAVTSIITLPTQDPHEFEPTAATARAVAEARLVIYNGAGYDPWAMQLLAASRSPSREIIEVAKLVDKKPGDNIHFWYEPAAVDVLGAVLAARLTKLDPEHSMDYARALAGFKAAMGQLRERISVLRGKYAGTAVTATEPVFDYMAAGLGLKMRNGRFQLAVMNGIEPSATAIAAFENDLRTHAVKILLYNSQTTEALAKRMRAIANQAGVPVVAVTETKPPELSYQQWMLAQLDALDRALAGR